MKLDTSHPDIKQLEDLVTGTGAHCEFSDTIPVLGRCDYINKVIHITSDKPMRTTLLIMAHEIGHWLTYLENMKNKSICRNDRERMAYERGWYLLCNSGLREKHHVTKEEWYDLNFINFNNYDPDVKEAWT